MNWLNLLTTIWLSAANGNPLKYRPVINIADVAKYTEFSDDYGDYFTREFSPQNAPEKKSDEGIKCAPVSFEDQDSVGGLLRKVLKPKTTCIPVGANPLRLRDSDIFDYHREGSTTTSTMAPYLDATSSTKIYDEMLKCDKVAVCREHKWLRRILDNAMGKKSLMKAAI